MNTQLGPLTTDYKTGDRVTVVGDGAHWVAYVVGKNPKNSAEYIITGSEGWKRERSFAVHWTGIRLTGVGAVNS